MPNIPGDIACATCSGSLEGAHLEGDCPACHRSIGDTLNTTVIDPAAMTVAGDVLCVGCGYNLRTLRIDAACPECARRVSDSLEPSDLGFADKAWLRKVRRGLTLLLVAVAAYVLGIVLFMLVLAFSSFAAGPPNLDPITAWVFVASLLFGVLGLAGLLLITAIEPNPRGRPRSTSANLTARWLVMLSVFTAFLAWPFSNTVHTAVSPGLYGMIALTAASFFLASSALILVLICLRQLAIRARRTGLRRLATAMSWLIAVGGLLQCAVQVSFALTIPQMQSMAAVGTTATPLPPPYGPTTPSGAVPASTSGARDESVDSSDEENPTAATVTSVVALPGPTSGSAVLVPAVTATPVAVPGWMILFGFLSCAGGLLTAVTFVLGVVLLVLYRRMLTHAIAGGVTDGNL